MPKAEASHTKAKSKASKPLVKRTTEIDDIFSTAKGKPKPSKVDAVSNATPTKSPSDLVTPKKGKEKKKKLLSPAVGETDSSGKLLGNDADKSAGSRKGTSRSAEPADSAGHVVVDRCTQIEAKARVLNEKLKSGKESDIKQLTEEDMKFADSRGTGQRQRTEEGYSIYKEAELGISGKGGGEPGLGKALAGRAEFCLWSKIPLSVLSTAIAASEPYSKCNFLDARIGLR
ncbi:hypothetical protein FRB90_003728 [Tulasnella sp. 427]|nr:hypothetical protein FRB90_003728 [Tulasnella sp. 427]